MDTCLPWYEGAPDLTAELPFLEPVDVGLADGHPLEVEAWLVEVVQEPTADHVCKVIVAVCVTNTSKSGEARGFGYARRE